MLPPVTSSAQSLSGQTGLLGHSPSCGAPPCPPRARKEGHPRRFTVTEQPARILTCAAAGPVDAATSFASRGSGVRVPLAPPAKTSDSDHGQDPCVPLACH